MKIVDEQYYIKWILNKPPVLLIQEAKALLSQFPESLEYKIRYDLLLELFDEEYSGKGSL